jgi:hypothetical protein
MSQNIKFESQKESGRIRIEKEHQMLVCSDDVSSFA